MKVPASEKSENLQVLVRKSLSLARMEGLLKKIAGDMGLYISHITTLGRRKYPGNRHWHFKRMEGGKGCLDVTYWPPEKLMWITMRNYEPDWVHKAGPVMKKKLEAELKK